MLKRYPGDETHAAIFVFVIFVLWSLGYSTQAVGFFYFTKVEAEIVDIGGSYKNRSLKCYFEIDGVGYTAEAKDQNLSKYKNKGIGDKVIIRCDPKNPEQLFNIHEAIIGLPMFTATLMIGSITFTLFMVYKNILSERILKILKAFCYITISLFCVAVLAVIIWILALTIIEFKALFL